MCHYIEFPQHVFAQYREFQFPIQTRYVFIPPDF